MKPKATTEHEDGLLEYLEDIIGTNVYKTHIEDATKELESVSVEREEKLNRLKIVRKDVTSLESLKEEAIGFIETENQITRLKISFINEICGMHKRNVKNCLEIWCVL